MADKSKVFWSNAERIYHRPPGSRFDVGNPELNRLPLLRAGIDALPIERQRKVIALSQAPWFVGMVQDEIRRRELEGRVGSDAATAVREQISKMHEWYAGQFARLDKIIPVIERMGDESPSSSSSDGSIPSRRSRSVRWTSSGSLRTRVTDIRSLASITWSWRRRWSSSSRP